MPIRSRTNVAARWPRRARGLPPGQRRLGTFPRFSDQPHRRPPPPPARVELRIGGPGLADRIVALDELLALPQHERRSDFHCVTTWSFQGLTWGGVSLADVWRAIVEPHADTAAVAPFAVAAGADGYRAVLHRDDLLSGDVLIAHTLDGAPLDARHGAPLRLVSPSQYGYKNVKHLAALELHATRPASTLRPKEHLRARVALEERHSRIPGRLLRLPYRAVVPVTIAVAERHAEPRPAADRDDGPPTDGPRGPARRGGPTD
ncbi:molybdopterin-dependent oxidoreductase [Patulibacter americanus]|uniref:molybdopterin-dependent oxidoreductase n=1 Tax=Patulibacter americanus TaxID=588672 RepID=UPI0003B60A37|nr:molybdopterin-dependent oxidoreductase [Patulibacter americanus]